MSPRVAHVVAIVAIVVELAVVTYVTVFAYLGSAWFVDDSWAFRATEGDWTKAALERFGTCLVIGAIIGICTWQLNRWLIVRGARLPGNVPKLSGGIAAISIVMASAVGAVQFVLEKPWL